MVTPDQYSVVFELPQKGFQWWFPASGLIFAVIGGVFIWLARRNHWPRSRSFFGYFMFGFACLWCGVVFPTILHQYLSLRTAYRHGRFSVVEGAVTNFRPMPYEGHTTECFSVQAEIFCYSDYAITAGFNNSASHGGPIREGLPVRVAYIGDTIVRLEVRSDALASAAQKAAVAEAAKQEWRQREERDPVNDRMNLGFGVAALFLTAWWNLQPRRFMRFWLKPPYKPITVTLFRVFFAANLIGAIWYFTGEVTGHRRPMSEYRAAALVAAAWIAVIWVMVTVMLRFARRREQRGGS